MLLYAIKRSALISTRFVQTPIEASSKRLSWRFPMNHLHSAYAHHIVQKQQLRKYSIQVLQDFEILVLLLECIPGLGTDGVTKTDEFSEKFQGGGHSGKLLASMWK